MVPARETYKSLKDLTFATFQSHHSLKADHNNIYMNLGEDPFLYFIDQRSTHIIQRTTRTCDLSRSVIF